MAFLGSLGKALGIKDSEFAKGVVTGFSTSVADELDDDLTLTKKTTQDLITRRVEKGDEYNEEYYKLYNKNENEIDALVGQLGKGGEDLMHSLITNYSFTGAKSMAAELITLSKETGQPAYKIANMTMRDIGANRATVPQLTNLVTIKRELPEIKDVDSRVGLVKMFGTKGDTKGEDISRRSAELLDAGGQFKPTVDEDMPSALGIEIDQFDLGRRADLLNEIQRMRVRALQLEKSTNPEDRDKASKVASEADALYAILQDTTTRLDKELTVPTIIRITNEMSGVLATTNSLGGKWAENGSGYIGRSDQAEVAEAIDNAGGYYANIIARAYKDKAKGVYKDETIEIIVLARIAAGQNKKLVYIPAQGDVPASVMMSNEQLIPETIFKLAGTAKNSGTIILQPNAQGSVTQQQTGPNATQPTGPINGTIIKGHIGKYNSASSASDKAAAIAELEAYLTNNGFTPQAAKKEAERYLNI